MNIPLDCHQSPDEVYVSMHMNTCSKNALLVDLHAHCRVKDTGYVINLDIFSRTLGIYTGVVEWNVQILTPVELHNLQENERKLRPPPLTISSHPH
jgi:hypothetical protein